MGCGRSIELLPQALSMFPKRGSVEEQRLEYKISTQEFPVYIIKMEEWQRKESPKDMYKITTQGEGL